MKLKSLPLASFWVKHIHTSVVPKHVLSTTYMVHDPNCLSQSRVAKLLLCSFDCGHFGNISKCTHDCDTYFLFAALCEWVEVIGNRVIGSWLQISNAEDLHFFLAAFWAMLPLNGCNQWDLSICSDCIYEVRACAQIWLISLFSRYLLAIASLCRSWIQSPPLVRRP